MWNVVRQNVRDHQIDKKVFGDEKRTKYDKLQSMQRVHDKSRVRRFVNDMALRMADARYAWINHSILILMRVYTIATTIQLLSSSSLDSQSVHLTQAVLIVHCISILLYAIYTYNVLKRPLALRQRSSHLTDTKKHKVLKVCIGILGLVAVTLVTLREVMNDGSAFKTASGAFNIVLSIVFLALDISGMKEELYRSKKIQKNIISLWTKRSPSPHTRSGGQGEFTAKNVSHQLEQEVHPRTQTLTFAASAPA